MINIYTLGGYEEVGKNMTAIEYNGEVVIIDMGIRLDRVLIHEDVEFQKMPSKELRKIGAIPDDTPIRNKKVVAIAFSHGHLDHIGAVAKLAPHYPDVPIYGTPYTIKLAKSEVKSEQYFEVKNPMYETQYGEIVQVSENLAIEFVQITHSIPQSSIVVVHTPEGAVVYACDYKFDNNSPLGEKPDYKRLKEIGKEGVKILIAESTRVAEETKTPSEAVAKMLLEDFFYYDGMEEKGLIATTFASHIARLQELIEIANNMGRQAILVGRSLAKYTGIAKQLGLIKMKGSRVLRSPNAVQKALKEISQARENYLLIVTGHQGEPGAVLTRMANGELYDLGKDDTVVFSAGVIPNPLNIAQRYALEIKLRMRGVRIIKNLHVSGHASREDHRYLIKMLNPENIVPAHGDFRMLTHYAELAEEEGYLIGRDVFVSRNGYKVEIAR
ncbi:RNase J family beta-CASP ribonuclease [Thermococcus sp. M39]|uniref:RNase J family beta-CASP ribonuclease n=1 Tax=unclassified Thermococcus TaxID=2627626 RepID=UPI00143A9775|nr:MULTISPECIES: RNase J family beta-CASP ribonuclease [unclassified Thermococcus]NJE07242.1 RNase J family beta-CASP ribonuclease [Thermococcus sp. M39]NJE12626.1 RNase J family beta-CASP ribonuclease [Thermococcus sp. LS2]